MTLLEQYMAELEEQLEAERERAESYAGVIGKLDEQLAKIRAAAERQIEGEYQPGWVSCSWLVHVIDGSNPAERPS